MILDFLVLGALISAVLTITSINPVNSVIGLISVYIHIAVYLTILTLNFIGLTYLIIYVGAIAILFLFVVMMMNVRFCTIIVRVAISFNPCSDGILISELAQRETLRVNIASQLKGNIHKSSKQGERIDSQINLSMVRTILFEVYSFDISHHGSQPTFSWLCRIISFLYSWSEIRTISNQRAVSLIKMRNGLPKESVIETIIGTGGSPKGSNSYGDRVFIVPEVNPYANPNRFGRGRDTGIHFNNKLGVSFGEAKRPTRKGRELIIPNKLLSLGEWCRSHPNNIVDRSIYPLLSDPRVLEIAYDKLKSKPGNMTPGIVPTTLDGFSSEYIDKIIQEMKNESFQFTTRRRSCAYIPKMSGAKRPLTSTSLSDVLVQEAMRMILEAIFEPTFSDNSHGFRMGRSCHTALRDIKKRFTVATWYIKGDISKCFDSIEHHKLMKIIEEKILDRRFTNLIWKALRAGYFEFRYYQHSIVGTPQGSVISPILSNIFLDKLDKFIDNLKKEFNIGKRPKPYPAYTGLRYNPIQSSDTQESKNILKSMQLLPYSDPFDPNFKRLVYVRYADDWIIGIRGSKSEAIKTLDKIELFLKKELGLTLNRDKSAISHSGTEKALFLGTLIGKSHHRHTISGQKVRQSLDLRFEAPLSRITKKLTEAGFIKGGVPYPKFLWLHNSKDEIVHLYDAEINGYLNYYSFVYNYAKFAGWVYKNLRSSCCKLLAAKFNLGSQNKVYLKYGKNLMGKDKVALVKITYKI